MITASCHPSRKHYSKGLCINCYKASYRAANREAIRAYDRAAYQRHKESRRQSKRAYYWGDSLARERIQAAARRRAAEKPEEARARKTAWYWANLEKARAKHRQEAASRRASCAGRTARPATLAERAALVAPGVLCTYCRSAQAVHVDHFIPLSRWGGLPSSERGAGPDHLSNLVGACAACNLSKGAKLPSEWRGRRKP